VNAGRRALSAAVVAAFLACLPAAGSASPTPAVVASQLDNPRKLFLGADGSVYVVEAGAGGRDTCVGTGANTTCVGLTGAITRIADGARKRVLTGLVSAARRDGEMAQGPADVLVRGRTFYVLLQNGSIDARGFNRLGPDGATAGDLVSSPGGKAAPEVIFNFAAFEAANNPDRGRGPGARFGSPPIDSDPYAFAAYRGGFAVADAAGNDLLWIGPDGKVTVLAVFPVRTEPLSRAAGQTIGAPAGMTSIAVQAVPSSVAVGPDGALYVGELSGVPFTPGSARVWRVVPGKKPSVYASGFTTISDLAFAGRNLLVLELSTKGLLAGRSPGALIKLTPAGRRTVIASDGLLYPTGLAVGRRSIYVANNGLFPAAGAGPRGELVSLPASLGS
jgi:hypothetical protein